ncbi:MAG: prepilin-type N-terminal cleavage/methylation domain-containing protein [Candidatus Omnitrophota bacterium]
MRKKAFTLVEIMIALIIVSVVVSLSIVTFQKTIEANNDKICRQNLKVLQGAIEIYTIENNALPAALSLLTSEQIHLAHEKVTGKPKENRVAGYFNNLIGIRPAIAQGLGKYYGNDPKVRRCPADKTVSADTSYTSYTLNDDVFKSKDDLEDYPDIVLLSDAGYYHKKDIFSGKTYQIVISPSGEYGTFTKQTNNTITQDDEISFDEELTASPCASYTKKNKCNNIKTGCLWKQGDCIVDPCATNSTEADCDDEDNEDDECEWKENKAVCRTDKED